MWKQRPVKKTETSVFISSFNNSSSRLHVPQLSHSSFTISIPNSLESKLNLPSLLLSFLLLTGLVPEFSKNLQLQKVWFIFYLLLLSQILDMLVMLIINFENRTTLKSHAAYLFSVFCNIMIWHSLRRKKKNLLNVLRVIQKCPATHNRRTNIMVLIILSFPFVYSVTSILTCNITSDYLLYAYGYELKSLIMQASVIFFKKFLLFLFHSTFPSLVAVLFCYLCLRFSLSFNCLTRTVLHYSPEEFGPSEQIEILRQKAKIDDIMENLQDIFSLPSFFLIMSHLFTCGSHLGMNLTGNHSKIIIVKAVFYGMTNLVSLVVVLWIAGSVPVEQNKLKSAFYKKAHSRFLTVLIPEERHCKREILDKTDFVLNGCSIFPYTRNSILALIGTLLTYSLLIYQN
ncbi:uncharacterized protein TNIN_268381 [Trichonephila inaurata madagascariensis]|uniref:Uncharacterized protein n=1 Tax=Trichonephila inaurata madagascariensis TaxID=2747483 RepID=A0A8X7CU05_9ARAC|nr:uncharacterized protein TNIN_268381 [Trichonephila inaurata madagascariensis]